MALGGGNMMEDRGLSVYVPNITSDDETGLGRWTDDQLMRALRDGIRPDGALLFPMMPFGSYRHLSDEDTRAVVVYLRSLPKVRTSRARQENKVPLYAKFAIYSLGVAHHSPVSNVRAPDRSDTVHYGQYLMQIAQCADCHALGKMFPVKPTDDGFLSGSAGPFEMPGYGKVWASNLTPDGETGLGMRSDAAIKQALRTGIRFDGKTMAPPMSIMRQHYAAMTDADLDALISYLRTLKPVKKATPPRQLPAEAKARLGET